MNPLGDDNFALWENRLGRSIGTREDSQILLVKEVKAVIFVCDGDPVQCPELAYEHGKHHSLFPSFFFFLSMALN